ncbi:TBC1 domain family member 17 isoform X2 [Ischnura elegans]|uniref:TBC1 domain family member 17 isoform X2 n=1 Tax=Ischnura elegans TaxID=197161 RepID=UPI001ED8875B|nr:TBC1 domain family member 17 isoform X2 [Ischnura elegans]
MDSSMEELTGDGEVQYSHHGVIIRDLNQNRDDDSYCSGTLYLKKYSYGMFIEWIQTEEKPLSVEPQEGWAMVTTIKEQPRSAADGAEGAASMAKIRPIKIDITDLKSYKIKNNSHELTLTLKDGSRPSPLLFQNDNADKFISALREYIFFDRSDREPNLYCAKSMQKLTKSFADLNLPAIDDGGSSKWGILAPYEKTMTIFSKVANVVSPDEEYEVITSGPVFTLPPRPEVKRGPPLTTEEWARHLDENGRIINLPDLKEKIFRGGLSLTLRYDVWKVLLDYMPCDKTSEEWQAVRKQKLEEYARMKLQWSSMSAGQESRFSQFHKKKSIIEKDVNRTDRTIPYFEGNDNPNLKILYNILMTYVMYNFDLGYVQGMSDLLSPILYLMEKEEDAFWCFVGFMNKVSKNFAKDQIGMSQQLSNLNLLIRIVDPEMADYLEKKEADNLFFCFRWLLILFKREFSYQDIMTLWEVLWTDLPGPNFHLFICLAILESERDTLLSNEYGFNEILKHINDLSLHIHLEDTLTKAEAIYLQLSSAENLPDRVRVILGKAPLNPESDSDSDEDFAPATSGQNSEPSAVHVPSTSSTMLNPSEQMFEDSLSFQF